MLAGFCSFEILNDEFNNIKAVINFNDKHEIYNGHFPGMPIVPGVCIIQIIKEILSGILNKKLLLINAGSIKFLRVIEPDINASMILNAKIKINTENIFCADAFISDSNDIFMKFNGKYIEVD